MNILYTFKAMYAEQKTRMNVFGATFIPISITRSRYTVTATARATQGSASMSRCVDFQHVEHAVILIAIDLRNRVAFMYCSVGDSISPAVDYVGRA